MGWFRGRYFRPIRHGDKVRNLYFGRGPLADQAAEWDDINRQARVEAKGKLAAAEEADRKAFVAVQERASKVDAIVTRGLEAAGFHRKGRHPWRRKRGTMKTPPAVMAAETRPLADLARICEETALDAISPDGENPGFLKALASKLASLRTELAGPEPVSLPVRLLAEAASLAWADFYCVEIIAAGRRKNRLTITTALDRRRGFSVRRFTHLLNSLELCRRLTRPRVPRVAVQIIQNGPVPSPSINGDH
jgi:hypothetical protein